MSLRVKQRCISASSLTPTLSRRERGKNIFLD